MRPRLLLFFFAVVGPSAGCSDCGRAAPSAAADAGAPASSAAASAAALAGGRPGTVIVSGLSEPSALAASATHLFIADAAAGTILRVGRDGGPPEVLAREQDRPSMLALLGEDVVWLNAPSGKRTPAAADDGRSGVFKCTPSKVPCAVQPVRKGSFASMVTTDKDVFLTESLDEKRFAVSRVTGPTVARIGEHDGKPTAMTADEANAYVATFGTSNKPKIIQLPRAPGEQRELTFSGPGFNAIGDDGDQLLGTGVIDRKFGLFRVAKGTGLASLLAPDVAPGVFATSGELVYFVSGKDLALHKVPRAGGPGTVVATIPQITEPTDLVVDGDSAYVSGKEAGDAGGTGAIVRVSLR